MPSAPTMDAAYLFEEFILPGGILLIVAVLAVSAYAKYVGYHKRDD